MPPPSDSRNNPLKSAEADLAGVSPAIAMAPREALATIAEIAAAYADEAALAGLSLRSVTLILKVIADTARLAGGPPPG
jgi:hypothetical protein